MIKTLDKGNIGELLEVVQIFPSEISSKLLEMGLYEGKKVFVRFKAPFGDPIAVQVGDYLLSMRKNEARLIEVKAVKTT